MRSRLLLLLSLFLIAGLAAPASADPGNSPVFVEEPFFLEIEFPNPCLGEDVVEWYQAEGRLLIHDFTNPSGNYHYLDLGYLSLSTESGFVAPEKMIGVDVENVSDNTSTYTGTGLYQLRNDDGQKLRFQLKIQATIVDGDMKVDIFALDISCLGNNK